MRNSICSGITVDPDHRPQRVYIVDDRSTARSVLEGLARTLRPQVIVECFCNARCALKRMEQVAPDLVITDYCMPDMDGIELIRQARTMPHLADVPIVMITTSTDLKIVHEAMESGATDFHLRPIDPKKSCARWAELLMQRHTKSVAAANKKNTPSQPGT